MEKPFGRIFIEYGNPIEFDKEMQLDDCTANFISAMEQTESNNLYNANKSKI